MKTSSEDSTINDDIAAAISELEAEGTTATDAVEKLEPTTQERDENGKFKGKEKVEHEETTEADKEPAEPVTAKTEKDPEQAPLGGDPILSQDKAPSSWTPKARESWAALPEDARKEILRREEDSVKGIRQLQEQMAPYTQFAQNLEPFIKEAIDNRVDPSQYIGNVMQSERRLRTGSAEQRFSSLVEIAESYGIPLRRIINDAMGTEVVPDPFLSKQQNSLPPEVQRELEESRAFREQHTTKQVAENTNALQAEIDKFKADPKHEFFDDVREDMGILMGAGKATSLEQAYEIACRMNTGVYDTLQQRSSKQSALTDKQVAAAKLNGTSSNSAETGNADFDDDDDLATTVRKATAQSGGRI